MHVGRLGNEQGRHGHIDVRAIEVERISGGHHQSHHRACAASILQLVDQQRQRRLRRAGRQHQQQFLAQVAQQPQQREPAEAGNRAQHGKHEQRAGQIEAQHQSAQMRERADPELPDGIGHGPQRAERRGSHDQVHDPVHHRAERFDAALQAARALTGQREPEAK